MQNQAFFPLSGTERHSYILQSAHNRLRVTRDVAEKIQLRTFA